jgi:hypothetical protein
MSSTNSEASQIAIFLSNPNDLTSHSNSIAYLRSWSQINYISHQSDFAKLPFHRTIKGTM